MAGRPSIKMHADQAGTEINLVPLMNVFCILIPFLVLSAVFVQLSVLDTTLPSAMTEPKTPSSDPPEKPKLTLTVAMTDKGFSIAGFGGVLDVGEQPEQAAEGQKREPQYIIPKIVVDGEEQFDYDKLQEQLVKVKDKFPEQYSIILLPENQVEYQEIVTTMDVAREKRIENESGEVSRRLLFPNPVLAAGLK